MKNSNITETGGSLFDDIRKVDENGNEYWLARELSRALEYTDFRNFTNAVDKAKEACANSQQKVSNHFVDINEMVQIGSGAERSLSSFKLSRYACYLIVQNADPSKEVVETKQCKQ